MSSIGKNKNVRHYWFPPGKTNSTCNVCGCKRKMETRDGKQVTVYTRDGREYIGKAPDCFFKEY